MNSEVKQGALLFPWNLRYFYKTDFHLRFWETLSLVKIFHGLIQPKRDINFFPFFFFLSFVKSFTTAKITKQIVQIKSSMAQTIAFVFLWEKSKYQSIPTDGSKSQKIIQSKLFCCWIIYKLLFTNSFALNKLFTLVLKFQKQSNSTNRH